MSRSTTPVSVLAPAPRDEWREILAADPDAVASQSPEWLDALCRRTGMVDATRLYLVPGGRRIVVPLVARRVAGVSLTAESMPYGWGYGGALVEGGGLRREEAALVLGDLHRRHRARTCIVPSPTTAVIWGEAAGAAVGHERRHCEVIDTGAGFDAVWAGYGSRLRRNIRRAERDGVVVERSTTGAFVPEFTRLYAESVDRWAEQRGQPLTLARALARRRDRPGQAAAVAAALGDRCVMWRASRHGEVVAVHVVLYQGGTVHGWMGVNDHRLNRETNGNMLLHSAVIEDACARGARAVLLGESDPGSPVEEFKLRFGASCIDYDTLRMEPVPITAAAHRARWAAETVLRHRFETREREFA